MNPDEAYEEYVAQGADSLYRYAYVLTGDAAQAQDLTQEALVRLYENRRRVEPGAYPAYARRTVHNLNVSWWRRITRRERALPQTDDDPQLPHLTDGADSRALQSAVNHAIAQLPPRARAAMALHYLDDLPIAEVAEALECSEANVRTLLTRGRAMLRPLLSEDLARS